MKWSVATHILSAIISHSISGDQWKAQVLRRCASGKAQFSWSVFASKSMISSMPHRPATPSPHPKIDNASRDMTTCVCLVELSSRLTHPNMPWIPFLESAMAKLKDRRYQPGHTGGSRPYEQFR